MEPENRYKLSENTNFSDPNEGNICRICFKKCLDKWELFQNGDVLLKLMAFTAIQIEEGDGLPTNICLNCRHLVNMSYNFKLQVEKSDITLRETLQKGVKFSELLPQSIQGIVYDEIEFKDEKLTSFQTCDNYAEENQPVPEDVNTQEIKLDEVHDLECNNYESCLKNENFTLDQDTNNMSDQENENNDSDNDLYIDNCASYSYGSEFVKDKVPNKEIVNKINIDNTFQTKEEKDVNREESDDERPLIQRSQRHKCSHCIKTFASKVALEKHIQIHENKTKFCYTCYLCEKRFSTMSKTRIHIYGSHGTEPDIEKILVSSIKLELNEKISDNESDAVNKDLPQEKKITKFVCKICAKQFTYQKSFMSHAKCHPEYKDEFPNDSSTMADGVDSVLESNSNTSLCKSNDSEEDEMLAENIQCTQCGKLFATHRNLKRHLQTHSGLKHNCSICGKDFSRLDKLREHEQCKHKEELFGRTDSEDESSSEGVSGIPSKIKKEKNNRPHKCGLCPKAFAQAQSLANHLERHKRVRDVQKRFLCDVCSKCFAQSGSLVAHMRTHTGIKPYVCNVCSRAFTKSTYLQLHLRTHSGEKPYICQYCSRAFARANTLARHITMHTGEAKYHCQICSKSFRRLTSLNEHTYTHTGQRPYACKICSKRYNNAGSLYAHTKKCKVQQSSMNANNFTASIGSIETDNVVPQVLIYSQKKLTDEPVLGQSVQPQFVFASTNNQKPLSNNPIQPFAVAEQDVYSMNSKPFNTPYYGIYPSM